MPCSFSLQLIFFSEQPFHLLSQASSLANFSHKLAQNRFGIMAVRPSGIHSSYERYQLISLFVTPFGGEFFLTQLRGIFSRLMLFLFRRPIVICHYIGSCTSVSHQSGGFYIINSCRNQFNQGAVLPKALRYMVLFTQEINDRSSFPSLVQASPACSMSA